MPIGARELEILGYPRQWMELGLLDEAFLRAQLDHLGSQQAAGEHVGTEHYRYPAFRSLLKRDAFDDALVERYLSLAALDPDRFMARAAVFDLMEHHGLTDSQLELVGQSPLCTPRYLARTQLLRALRAGVRTDELLQTCIASREQGVHKALLGIDDLGREWIGKIATAGPTREIRHHARERLRRGSSSP